MGCLEELKERLGGREIVDAILRGEKTVTIKDAFKVLFDKHGFRSTEGLCDYNPGASAAHPLSQQSLERVTDYANRLQQLRECLGIDTGVTAQQFKTETERLLALIQGNRQVANILKGAWLPVVLPQLTVNDLGKAVKRYFEKIGKSYAKIFSGGKFLNYMEDELAGKVNIVDGSRQDQLIGKMREGPVIGIYFPNSLHGPSFCAQVEQMPGLPEGFILSGLDAIIAMAMHLDILVRDFSWLTMTTSGFSVGDDDNPLQLIISDQEFTIGPTSQPTWSDRDASGGLLFIG